MRIARLAAVFFAALLSAGALAQNPARPIRMLVPNPPGGATDTLARVIGPKLAEALALRATPLGAIVPWRAGGRGPQRRTAMSI